MKQQRAQKQLKRILLLIDALSPRRLPFTIKDAKYLLEERSGSHCTVCDRTTRRDLELLESINLVYVYKKGVRGSKGAGSELTQYKMNLTAIKNVLAASAKVTKNEPQ